MQALRFHGARSLTVDAVDAPPAPTGSEVLVAPAVCGICGTDIHEYTSGPSRTTVEPHPLTGGCIPQILGHEVSGAVVATGPDVRAVAVGDRVAVMPLQACGRCAPCRRGDGQLCEVRASIGLRHPWGGMAELMLADERQVAVLPEAVDWVQGALIEPLAVATAAVARAGLEPGASVLVTGAGPIGAFAALAAEAAGAGDLVVSEPNSARRDRLAALGHDVVDPAATDVVACCRERSGGVDVAIECSGSGAALDAALAAVRPGGTVVVAGMQAAPARLDVADLMLRGVALVGSVGYPGWWWPRLLAQVAARRLAPERLVTSSVPLAHAVTRGFEPLLDPATDELKVMVEVGPA